MPVVPIRPGEGQAMTPAQPQAQAPPSDTYLLMAASQMHSEGRLIQKVADETKGDFRAPGNDTGYEAMPGMNNDPNLYTKRNGVDTVPYPGDPESKTFDSDMSKFIKDKKLSPGDVAKDKSGRFWMYQPGGEWPHTQVRPKGKQEDLVS